MQFGVTRMRGKLGEDNAHTRVATIELSTKVIDDEERLRSTLLHEMCHAAQWLVDGVHKVGRYCTVCTLIHQCYVVYTLTMSSAFISLLMGETLRNGRQYLCERSGMWR